MRRDDRSAAVFILVSVYCIRECTAANATFADQLSASRLFATALAGKVQSEYQYVEADSACLKEITFRNCRSSENVGWNYFESGISCCNNGDSKNDNSLGHSGVEVGTCRFKDYFYSKAIEEAPGVSKLGEFTVQCHLNNNAGKCGAVPLCDQLVLSAKGGVYSFDDIVLGSRPLSSLADGSCSSDASSSGYAGAFKGRKFSNLASATHAAAQPASKGYPPSSLCSGSAVIYLGAMTINSRSHAVDVTQGWFEYVFSYTVGDPIPEAEAQGKHVVTPYTYNLKFFKRSNY